ncbi:TPA: hypothetical protein DDY55_02340 [Candidatus Falkowbacteria bacterium]|nr:hypothetical protein [Candidatus Falkowbacteria bacterium]HAY12434.1 hypothetical protein [Candidatus Falkowbacteria bacterium]HBI96941.1 hypothetical protein [Candidatus Falkowbacteria bacterium]HBT27599.1 hypothetical protein [Candidatus Falkowbacteria bacterium]HBY15288.1 hypothetical protein [Candidatus Falkowbacteria bacterium]
MMIGGVIWITAAGDSGRIGEAKQWITGAVTGMVLVFSSYTILYFVNPDLVKLKPIKVERIVKMEPLKPANISTNAFVSNACKDTGSNKVIYFNNYSEKTPIPSACSAYSAEFAKYGVDKKILTAIASQESGCNPGLTSSAGACGIMQLMPDTAKIYNKDASCEWLIQHPEESIKIASYYIIANTNLNTKTSDIFAGYNSGYGTGVVNGKVGGLAPSSDCKGFKAYECCINPGGLVETQDYVMKTLGYYNSQ